MEEKVYWKVLNSETERCSLSRNSLNPMFVVNYPVKVWVKAPIGGLFVFKTEMDAIEMYNGIFCVKCQVRGIIHSKERLEIGVLDNLSLVHKFWEYNEKSCIGKMFSKNKFEYASCGLPYGTVLVKEVFCLE